MRTKIFIGSVALFVFLALALVTGTALANTLPSGNLCGTSGPYGDPSGLVVKKDVFCEYERAWDWEITKTVDKDTLLLSLGQTFQVNYQVIASAAPVDSKFHVSGDIGFTNRGSAPLTISNVSDTLGPVTCDETFPYVLVPGDTVRCTYDNILASQAPENSATVTTLDGAQVTAIAPINWSQAAISSETGQCVYVSDSLAGPLGQVCVGQDTRFTFNYPYTIGPYDACGEYSVANTATIIETGANASATVDVSIPCAGGCTLTPGYWKTHSISGPAPYNSTWALLGEHTIFFSSGKTYYNVLWTAPQGNAYYILAHAYIAAKLNQLNGANFSAAQPAFDAATALFSNPANTPAAVGALRGSAKATWTNLATTLDNYNNGLIGPGHCFE